MHDRQYLHLLGVMEVDKAIGEATHKKAPRIFGESRPRVGVLENGADAALHFCAKIAAEPRSAGLVPRDCLFELLRGFGMELNLLHASSL